MGYAFTCPDMIGGGEYLSFRDASKLDEELVVRAAQVHALMPMMQFSAAPWRVLSARNLEIVRSAATLHERLGPEILVLAKQSAVAANRSPGRWNISIPGSGTAGSRISSCSVRRFWSRRW